MTDAGSHAIETVDLEDGVPTTEVSPETIRSGLASDRPTVRSKAATVAAGLTQRDPAVLYDLAPVLMDSLDDDQRVVRYQSLIALSHVAEDDPGALGPAIDRLVALLSAELPVVRLLAARILGFVVLEQPEALTAHVEALLAAARDEPADVLDPDEIENTVAEAHGRRSVETVTREVQRQQSLARDTLVNVLVEVAEHDPEALAAHVPALADLLADDHAGVVTAAADVCRILAETDPETVAPAVEPLCDVLEKPDDSVVATAVPALGYAGDPTAIEPLRAVADDEGRSAELRDLAAETADFLAIERD